MIIITRKVYEVRVERQAATGDHSPVSHLTVSWIRCFWVKTRPPLSRFNKHGKTINKNKNKKQFSPRLPLSVCCFFSETFPTQAVPGGHCGVSKEQVLLPFRGVLRGEGRRSLRGPPDVSRSVSPPCCADAAFRTRPLLVQSQSCVLTESHGVTEWPVRSEMNV